MIESPLNLHINLNYLSFAIMAQSSPDSNWRGSGNIILGYFIGNAVMWDRQRTNIIALFSLVP
jgi:hypothetical protein